MLAGDTWDSNVILQAAKGKDVNVTVTTFYPEGAVADFDSSIKTWINGDKTNLANNGGDDTVAAVTAMGYDAYFFALAALQKAGSTDPAKVMEAIWSTEIDGVTGPIVLDQTNGDAIRNPAFVKQAGPVKAIVNIKTGEARVFANEDVISASKVTDGRFTIDGVTYGKKDTLNGFARYAPLKEAKKSLRKRLSINGPIVTAAMRVLHRL